MDMGVILPLVITQPTVRFAVETKLSSNLCSSFITNIGQINNLLPGRVEGRKHPFPTLIRLWRNMNSSLLFVILAKMCCII